MLSQRRHTFSHAMTSRNAETLDALVVSSLRVIPARPPLESIITARRLLDREHRSIGSEGEGEGKGEGVESVTRVSLSRGVRKGRKPRAISRRSSTPNDPGFALTILSALSTDLNGDATFATAVSDSQRGASFRKSSAARKGELGRWLAQIPTAARCSPSKMLRRRWRRALNRDVYDYDARCITQGREIGGEQ